MVNAEGVVFLEEEEDEDEEKIGYIFDEAKLEPSHERDEGMVAVVIRV